MTSALPPISWSEFPKECVLYFALAGVLHLAIFVIGSLVLGVVSIRQRGTFRRRVGRFGLFLGLLLMVGSISNGLWSCLIWGHLYTCFDYVVDFSPFWPVTQSNIDVPFFPQGQLLGVSLFQLQLVWLLFAVGTWGLTIFLYRFIRSRPQANNPLQATAAAPGS
jgi:hypothetical protein